MFFLLVEKSVNRKYFLDKEKLNMIFRKKKLYLFIYFGWNIFSRSCDFFKKYYIIF